MNVCLYIRCVSVPALLYVCLQCVDADTFPTAKAAVPPGLFLAVITLMSVLQQFIFDWHIQFMKELKCAVLKRAASGWKVLCRTGSDMIYIFSKSHSDSLFKLKDQKQESEHEHQEMIELPSERKRQLQTISSKIPKNMGAAAQAYLVMSSISKWMHITFFK